MKAWRIRLRDWEDSSLQHRMCFSELSFFSFRRIVSKLSIEAGKNSQTFEKRKITFFSQYHIMTKEVKTTVLDSDYLPSLKALWELIGSFETSLWVLARWNVMVKSSFPISHATYQPLGEVSLLFVPFHFLESVGQKLEHSQQVTR